LPVGRALIAGSPYLGVYVRAGESAGLVPPSTPGALRRTLERILGVKVHTATVAESELLGALIAFNSHGVVVGERLDLPEQRQLEAIAPVTEVRAKHNAIGNNVLANDMGALVHPEFSDDTLRRIGEALRVPVERGTIAGLGTVGMAGSATNKGVVVHPKATDREVEAITRALSAPVHRSTANFGVGIVGACLVANSRGVLVGLPTTPVEIIHLQEGFGVFD
jgi:translation initiation factor 6